MNNAAKSPFPPLNLKEQGRLDENQMAELIAEQGAPSLVKPLRPPSILAKNLAESANDPEWTDEVKAGLAEIADRQTAAVPATKEPRQKRRAKMVRLNIEIPEYVMQAIKEKAVKDKSTVRGIVLRGLKNLRLPIADDDMAADGRKSK